MSTWEGLVRGEVCGGGGKGRGKEKGLACLGPYCSLSVLHLYGLI